MVAEINDSEKEKKILIKRLPSLRRSSRERNQDKEIKLEEDGVMVKKKMRLDERKNRGTWLEEQKRKAHATNGGW